MTTEQRLNSLTHQYLHQMEEHGAGAVVVLFEFPDQGNYTSYHRGVGSPRAQMGLMQERIEESHARQIAYELSHLRDGEDDEEEA